MALRLSCGFRKYLWVPQWGELHEYFSRLTRLMSKSDSEARFWGFSSDSAGDVDKGYVSPEGLVELCNERRAEAEQRKKNTVHILLVRRSKDDEETWKVNIVFSIIPHITVWLVERPTNTGTSSELNQGERINLVTSGLADVAFDSKQVIGFSPALYIDRKLFSSKKSSTRAVESFWERSNKLSNMREAVEQNLTGGDKQPKILDKKVIRIFLDECDQRLLKALGPSRFEGLVTSLGFSFDEWLRL